LGLNVTFINHEAKSALYMVISQPKDIDYDN